MQFEKWLDTFVEEKGLDPEHIFEVKGEWGANIMPLQIILDAMKQAPTEEQEAIRDKIVQMDFANAPVLPFFEHLAGALAL